MSAFSASSADPSSFTLTKDGRALLEDGRSLGVPLEWFPRLRGATAEQRAQGRPIGPGSGTSWQDLDEDIPVAGLLGLPD